MKIVLLGSFSLTEEQKQRLAAVGDVSEHNPQTNEEWVELANAADVVCSDGSFLAKNMYALKDVFVTYPYIEIGSFDSQKLENNNVIIANTKGSNRDAIAEWTLFMILSLFRKLPRMVNIKETLPFHTTEGLTGNKVTIIGKGKIGTRVGELCEAFDMDVRYFTREEDLFASVKDADLVVNALSCTPSSNNLLDKKFFSQLNAYYVTFARPYTYDVDALIAGLDAGTVLGAAIDCDPEKLFDTTNPFYKKVCAHEKILATPHMAGMTSISLKNGQEFLVQNVENHAKGLHPNKLVKK